VATEAKISRGRSGAKGAIVIGTKSRSQLMIVVPV
jgi:hypothetical protein